MLKPNRQARSRVRASLARCAPGALALSTLAGCSNPLGPIDADYGNQPPLSRLRSVERLDRAKFSEQTVPKDAEPPTPGAPYVTPITNAPKFDLTLEQARAAVLTNNLDLKVALVDPLISDENLRAQEAKFEAVFRPLATYRDSNNPTLDVTTPNEEQQWNIGGGVDVPLRSGGTASVDLLESRVDTPNPFFTLNKSWNASLTFALSQPLARNAGRRVNTYSIRIANYDSSITQAQTKLEVIRQLAAADRSYWRLYAAREALRVRQQQYEVAVDQLGRAQRRVAAGDAPELEVTRAQSGAASQLESIIQAEKTLLDTQRDIKRLLNIPGLDMESSTAVVPTTPPDPVQFAFNAPDLANFAVENRMEMLELELRLAQDFSTIEYNKNQALPQFVLDFAYSIPGLGGTFYAANQQMSEAQFSSWSVGISGQIPIGNEAAKARVQQAILTRLQRLSTKDARRIAIRQEVLASVTSINAAWQRILASRQAVVLAARTLEGEQRQFDAGARTSSDVLDAAARLADEQTNEIRALTEYQIAQVDLAFATGTLLGAAKVDWQPLDPRIGQPNGGDPTPMAFPPYPDPAKVMTPAQREQLNKEMDAVRAEGAGGADVPVSPPAKPVE